jgi:hypothetical protein
MDYLHDSYPALIHRLETLEELAAEEAGQLQAVAGGTNLTTGQKWAIGGSVGGVGLTALGIYLYRKRKRPAASTVVQDARHDVLAEAQHRVEHLEADVKQTVVRDKNEIYNKKVANYEKNLPERVEALKSDHGKQIANALDNDSLSSCIKGHEKWVGEKMAEKFIPTPKALEDMVFNTKHPVLEVRELSTVYIEPRIDVFAENNLNKGLLDRALRVEIRREFREGGLPINKELRPELDEILTDEDIDNIFDLDKIIVHAALKTGDLPIVEIKNGEFTIDEARALSSDIFSDKSVGRSFFARHLDQWGGKAKIFAAGFDQRYPAARTGLREYIKENGLTDLSSMDRVEVLKHLRESSVFKGYIKEGEFDKLLRKATRDAAARAENLVKEKTDLKRSIGKVLGEQEKRVVSGIEKEAINDASAIKISEEKVLRREIGGVVTEEEKVLTGDLETKITDEVDEGIELVEIDVEDTVDAGRRFGRDVDFL